MPKVVHLPPTGALRTPVGHAIRTGETAFRRLEDLHAEGRLPARAVIVDASKATRPLRRPLVAQAAAATDRGPNVRAFHPCSAARNRQVVPKRDFEVIASTPRGQRLVAYTDRECCPHGLTSTLENHRSHIARQKFRAIDALFDVPDARRVYHFLNVELRGAEHLACDLVHLNVDDVRLNNTLSDWRKRIDSMTRMFETLSERTRPSPPPLKRRQGPGAPTHRSSA